MTLAADRFFRLNVAGPTSRVVSLSSSDVDLENVRSRLVSRYIGRLVTSIARGFLEMRSVPEVVKTECRPERRAVLNRVRLVYVTGSAGGQFVVWLVDVTRVAFRMLRHAGLQALVIKSMTEVAAWRALRHLVGIQLTFHLLGISVIAMRKALDTELRKLRRKWHYRFFSDWGLVTNNAHLAFNVREIFLVTIEASRMSGHCRSGIIGRAHVADGAILRFTLVLLAIVIERRDYFDQLRIHDVEWRLGDGSGGRRAFNRLVQVLLGASTRAKTGEHDERYRNYSF